MTRALVLAPSGAVLTGPEARFFREADPWGFILFQRNCETPDQLRRLTGELRASVGREAPILIDQEGGRVQRMRAPYWLEWPPPLDQVERSGANERAMYLRGLLIGSELRAHGIDVNCGPSADVAHAATHPFLRNRCYGTDPDTVAKMARANAEGLFDAGCLPVLKHAPGHGRATADSHLSLPVIDAPMSELRNIDFAPFRALSDLPLVMSAHVVLPEVDPETPVTLSAAGVALIRGDLRLDGLLMTDDISMGALTGPIDERGARAITAGCDLVLHCNGRMDEMEVLAGAIPRLTSAAARRADIAVSKRRTPTDIDIDALWAEFVDLVGGAPHA